MSMEEDNHKIVFDEDLRLLLAELIAGVEFDLDEALPEED